MSLAASSILLLGAVNTGTRWFFWAAATASNTSARGLPTSKPRRASTWPRRVDGVLAERTSLLPSGSYLGSLPPYFSSFRLFVGCRARWEGSRFGAGAARLLGRAVCFGA